MAHTDQKPLLILDLDETLVHSAEAPLAIPCDFRVGPYWVHRRPFLDDFLGSVASAFLLAVWSSSSADYLAAILEQIIPPGVRLEFVWSRSRCVQRYDREWQAPYWVKDLKKVRRRGYDLRRTLIGDDTPSKLERNFGNAVYVTSFEGDPADCELRSLALYLLSLVGEQNFRTIEKRGWRSRF